MSHIVKEFTATAKSATVITLTPLESNTGAGVDHPGSFVITGGSLTCCDKSGIMPIGKGVRMRLELHD